MRRTLNVRSLAKSGDMFVRGFFRGHVALLFLFVLLTSADEVASATGALSPLPSYTYVKAVYSLPLTLDPVQMNDTASLVAANLLYEGLLRFSPTLTIEPGLAEHWSTSTDGKTLTFHLRKNAHFHNGESITAQDVVASLRRALAKGSLVQRYYDCIADGGLLAPSVDTVVIRLKYPFPPILSVLAGATAKVLPAKHLNSPGFFDKPIGSGPFQFAGRMESPFKRIELRRFEGYYRGAPRLKYLTLQESTEAEATRAATTGGVHDLANWPLTGTNPVFQTGRKITSPVAATWIIGLNARMTPFDSTAMRRLFRRDVDTEEFRRRFYPDAFSASGYIPPGLTGYAAASEPKSRIIGKPSRKKIRVVIPKELARSDEMRAFLESTLRSKGWNIEVISQEWDSLIKGYTEKSHQAFLVSMNLDYPDAEFLLRNFESSNPDNFSGLRNARLDHILHVARTLRDRKQRQALYHQALGIVNEEAVTVNLFHPRANYWISNCVEGFEPNILADVYIDYASVALRPECGQNAGRL